jgi:hypothetical protein
MTAPERKKQIKEAIKLMHQASTLLLALGHDDAVFDDGLKLDADARHLDKLCAQGRKS